MPSSCRVILPSCDRKPLKTVTVPLKMCPGVKNVDPSKFD